MYLIHTFCYPIIRSIQICYQIHTKLLSDTYKCNYVRMVKSQSGVTADWLAVMAGRKAAGAMGEGT